MCSWKRLLNLKLLLVSTILKREIDGTFITCIIWAINTYCNNFFISLRASLSAYQFKVARVLTRFFSRALFIHDGWLVGRKTNANVWNWNDAEGFLKHDESVLEKVHSPSISWWWFVKGWSRLPGSLRRKVHGSLHAYNEDAWSYRQSRNASPVTNYYSLLYIINHPSYVT